MPDSPNSAEKDRSEKRATWKRLCDELWIMMDSGWYGDVRIPMQNGWVGKVEQKKVVQI